MFRLFIPILALIGSHGLGGQSPVELGRIDWERHFERGLQRSEQTGKPVFLLFQEVPGCRTCRNYGQEVLSHPLIVEAVEQLFVPVAIYNNRGGADAEVLKYYGEPSWNNPVVRIVGADRQDLTPRISGNYSSFAVVQAMIHVLQKTDRDIPAYLGILLEELQAESGGIAHATMAMFCFWSGRGLYGKLPGVIRTEPGFMHGREVVKIEYDPSTISLPELIQSGRQGNCADQVFVDGKADRATAARIVGPDGVKSTGAYRPAKDDKYYLSRTHYRAVPMTPLQATRANALIGAGRSPASVLSPR